MKKLVIVGVAAASVLLPASGAWARGNGWAPLNVQPFSTRCGRTLVRVSFPVNKEYFRLIPQSDGTTLDQVTGALVETFATAAGASVTVNISGPGASIIYPNGDFEFRGTGLNSEILTPQQAAALGLSVITYSKGPVDLLYHHGSITHAVLPPIVVDICAELGAA